MNHAMTSPSHAIEQDDPPAPESKTAQAMKLKRMASRKRAIAKCQGPYGHLERREAQLYEQQADALLALSQPPQVKTSEVALPHSSSMPIGRLTILNTLKDPDQVAEDASVARTDLLLQSNLNVVAQAIDAAASIQAENSLEKMLAHQLALAHEMALKIGNAAMGEVKKLEARQEYGHVARYDVTLEVQRLTNSTARVMDVYQQGLAALQRLRRGGNQTVTVQHVHVADGGQAVVTGNVRTRARRREGQAKK